MTYKERPAKFAVLARSIQRSLKYNSDPNATQIHHLRDTEEQRNYNDLHYEYWGFNQDGTFEYGKYVVFVTKEEHLNIHTHSEESRAKMSASHKKRFRDNTITDEQRASQSKRAKEWFSDNDNYTRWLDSLPREENHHMYGKAGELTPRYGVCGEKHPFYGKHHTEEAKQKISEAERGEKNHNYCKKFSEETRRKISENNARIWKGKHLPDETKKKLSKANKGKTLSEEHKKKIGEASRGRTHSDSAKRIIGEAAKERWMSDEYRQRVIASIKESQGDEQHRRSELYRKYKENGGSLKWNDFQKLISAIKKENKNAGMWSEDGFFAEPM